MIRLPLLAGMVALLAAGVAQAQTLPPASQICNPLLYGCGAGPANIFAANAPEVLVWVLNIATAICLAVIIWAGFHMLLSLGDEGHIAKDRMRVLWALIGLVIVISSQVIVGAVGTTNVGQAAGDPVAMVGAAFRAFILSIRVLLNVAFTIVAVIAGIRMVYAQGKQDEFAKGKTMLVGAITGALIINLATALIRAVVAIFQS